MALEVDTQFTQQTGLFAAELYQKIISNTKENVVISPLSISTCLSFAAMGAAGTTADQMLSVLKHGTAEQKSFIAQHYGTLMSNLNSDKCFAMANKMYIMKNYSTKQKFSTLANEHFRSETESVNFADNEGSAKTINTWVEKKTNDKIKDLISPDYLDENTRMVLVNAIYFKGTWTYQFDPKMTRKMPFWLTSSQSVDVDMMNLKKHFKYGMFEERGFSALELTYSNSSVSMLVLLPNERDGLARLEGQMSNLDLSEVTSKMHSQEVEVFLPKFKIEFDLDLGNTLKELGMTEMFSNKADFSELIEQDENLKVSKVVHKAFIEVNEEGTEAAAATAMIMMMRCMPVHPYFTADHPFMYILKNDQQILFMGRILKL